MRVLSKICGFCSGNFSKFLNFEKFPEQDPQIFEWSNKNADSVKWTTNKPTNDSNPNHAGQQDIF